MITPLFSTYPEKSTSGTWDTRFKDLNGIVDRNPSPYGTYPTTGSYYTVGDLVFYEIHILIFSPQTWGTSQTWQLELPFRMPRLNNISLSRQVGQGSIIFRSDEPPFYQYDGATNQVIQDWEEGEQLSLPLYLRSNYRADTTLPSVATLFVNLPRDIPSTVSTVTTTGFWPVGHNFPADLSEGIIDENPTLPTYVRFSVMGTYRKE